MPLNPGHDVVTFIYPGVVNDRLHKVDAVAASQFDQSGCNMQDLSVDDKVTNTEFSEATHRCLAPYTAQTETVKAEWFAQFNGGKFRILGVKRRRDGFGRGIHITFICKEENG